MDLMMARIDVSKPPGVSMAMMTRRASPFWRICCSEFTAYSSRSESIGPSMRRV